MAEQHRPLGEAPVQADTLLDDRGRIRKYEFRLGGAAALGEFAEDYAFFTPAILYLHGYFADNYLVDYLLVTKQAVRFYYYRFPSPLFDGLETETGDADWNYALWAIEKPYWQSFSDFICSLALVDPSRGFTLRYAEQRVSVRDPLVLNHHQPLTVSVFGIRTAEQSLAVLERTPTRSRPEFCAAFPGDASLASFANAIEQGKNPLREAHGDRT